MANCELCGKEDTLVDAIVEGSVVSVCSECAKFGNVLGPKEEVVEEKPKPRFVRERFSEEVETIVSDYAVKVRQAREKRGMKQEELAKAIAERESTLQKVESGHMKPSFPLAKKLEQFLRIELITKEEVSDEPIQKDDLFGPEARNVTIGDLIKFRKK